MKTETAQIKITLIDEPQYYVRGKHKDAHVAELGSVIDNQPNKKEWPFPPLAVRPVKKDGKDRFELIDGAHRWIVATIKHFVTVPAVIYKGVSDAEALGLQLRLNQHGLPLTQEQRNKTILVMYTDIKMTLAAIGKELNLTEASISRIVNEKQATKNKKKGGKAAAGVKKEKGAPGLRKFHILMDDLLALFTEYEGLAEEVYDNDIAASQIKSFMDHIREA